MKQIIIYTLANFTFYNSRPYSGEDDDAFANLIQEIEAEGQAEGLSESDLGDLEDFESIELVEEGSYLFIYIYLINNRMLQILQKYHAGSRVDG